MTVTNQKKYMLYILFIYFQKEILFSAINQLFYNY